MIRMTVVDDLQVELTAATSRLLTTADALSDSDVTAPSLLPGWTRGHVLTHVARNADGLVNLLTWARTGVVTPQYPSWEQREADIAAGAARPWPVLVADVRDSADRFAKAARMLSVEDWATRLELTRGPQPAARIPWRRLREVEVHHVDLAGGYTAADWPDAFTHRVLHEMATGLDGAALTLRPDGLGHRLAVGPGGPPEISGPAYALAAWLAGRSPGDGLTVDPPGPLPPLPDWI